MSGPDNTAGGHEHWNEEPPWMQQGAPQGGRGRQTQGRGSQGGGRGRQFQQRANNDRGEYVEVDKRIQEFYAKYPEGRLTSEIRDLTINGYEVQERRVQKDGGGVEVKQIPVLTGVVVVRAAAYRTPDDPLPGTGHSWMILPGRTPYTLGSELENAETSAWGRAIAAVGLATRGGIASADEIRAKSDDDTEDDTAVPAATDTATATDGQSGVSPALPVDTSASETVVPRSLDHVPDEQISAMTAEVLIELAREKFIPSATITSMARRLFGEGHTLRQLSDEQRQQLWHALTTGDISSTTSTESPPASESSTISS